MDTTDAENLTIIESNAPVASPAKRVFYFDESGGPPKAEQFFFFDEEAPGRFTLGGYGDAMLHLEAVEYFDRAEDAPVGQHVIINSGKVAVGDSMARNPSPRRGAVTLFFRSEICDEGIAINFVQHKGNTEIEFRTWDTSRPLIPEEN